MHLYAYENSGGEELQLCITRAKFCACRNDLCFGKLKIIDLYKGLCTYVLATRLVAIDRLAG